MGMFTTVEVIDTRTETIEASMRIDNGVAPSVAVEAATALIGVVHQVHEHLGQAGDMAPGETHYLGAVVNGEMVQPLKLTITVPTDKLTQ